MPLNDMSDKRDEHNLRLASVGQIAAGIAHEVRNPLTAVKGFLQLLQEQAPHNYIDIAQQELDNAISTLQNLLNVSKPDAEDEPVTRFSLCAELESLLSLFQDQIYRVTIEKSFEQPEVEISGRKNQLKRAFFNILKNSFEAIPGKGTIRISHSCDNNMVYVSISDSGVGIPREKLMLLGTPFFTTKSEGTGMGLTYVYSTVYQHGGSIRVESEEGQGTTFLLEFPLNVPVDKGVVVMDLQYEQGIQLKDFLNINKDEFEQRLLNEAVNIRDIIQEIKTIGNIDLLSNAQKLVHLMIDHKDLEIVNFAQQEGQLWARHSSLNLAVKLEWFQAIRRVLWDFIYNYERLSKQQITREQFFALERQINTTLDIFLRHFFMSYTRFKDELIQSHKELIDDLSVPIIPLSASVSILPLLGTVDTHRAKVIQEKALHQIGASKIRTLLIDMSGVAFLDTMVVKHLFKIMDGVSYMGCKAIVTGIRPEIASTIVDLGISFSDKVETKGTLQQALEELGLQILDSETKSTS